MAKKRDEQNKVEIAKKIAEQSEKVTKTYENVEIGFLRGIRLFSSSIDRLIFNPKYGAIVSLVLAVVLYFAINVNDAASLFNSATSSSHIFSDVPIVVEYNSDKWEVTGIPEATEVVIVGDQSTVTTQLNTTGYRVVANLTNLAAGTHTVRLTADNFIGGLDVKIDPTNITVTIEEKVTQNFDVGYDFINTDEIDTIYALGVPEFEMTKVAVRASQSTLDSIAYVKALIDVSGVSEDFETEAILVAYDQNGVPVDADIKPETVQARVSVTSPSKQVPIVIEPLGEVPNGLAIDSVVADNDAVTIFAPESVLSVIDRVTVTFDAAQLTEDIRLYEAINLPTGVKNMSTTRVNMDIKLAPSVTRVIENVPIFYRNNINGYVADYPQSTVSVRVSGTQTNIDRITADDIYVFLDLMDVQLGTQEVQIQVTPRNDLLVGFTPLTSSLTITFRDPAELEASDEVAPEGE